MVRNICCAKYIPSTVGKRDCLVPNLKSFSICCNHLFCIIFRPGIDLIEWITKLLDVHSTTEATHLATLLSQYGYIYPVEATKTVSIKEDNTLHRFQSPYFWTSQDRSHDNTDYGKIMLLSNNLSALSHPIRFFFF